MDDYTSDISIDAHNGYYIMQNKSVEDIIERLGLKYFGYVIYWPNARQKIIQTAKRVVQILYRRKRKKNQNVPVQTEVLVS